MPSAGVTPEGFRYEPGLLSQAEHDLLLDRVRALPFEEVRFHGYAALRSVAHFGFRYDYDGRSLTPTAPLPVELEEARRRAAALAALGAEQFDEALVTRYPPGAGIGWHRDAPHFGSPVIGVSLGAPCTLRLRKELGERRYARHAIELLPGSVYVLGGPARWEWQHEIPAVSAERFSITFRVVRWKQKAMGAAPRASA